MEISKQKSSTVSTREVIKFISSYFNRYKKQYMLGIIMLVLVDLFQLVIPKIIQYVLDRLSSENLDRTIITRYIVIILILGGAMVIARFFWRLGINGGARKIEADMREHLFSHIQSLSFSYFNRSKTGDLMALLVNDINMVRMSCSMALIGLVDALFMGVMSIVFMMASDVRLTLLTIVPLPIIVLFMMKASTLLQSLFKSVQESFAGISSVTQETFSGIRVIKGFVQEEAEMARFNVQCNDYVDKNIKLVSVWGLFFPIISLLASLSFTLLFLVGGRYVITQKITLGTFVSFTFYINLLVWPMIATGMVYSMLQRGIASAKRILELLKEKPEIIDTPASHESVFTIQGAIRMHNLSFSYPGIDRMALESIDLSIPLGSSLGIIGKPGSGKSTLVALLFRLFNLPRGRLFIDEFDIADIPLSLLRRSIGFVPQDSFLFSDTILNNIALGLPYERIDRQQVEACARSAAVYEDIINFHDGFDTKIGERGITLSGGQRQRVAIARALLVDPAILVLDDALCAVDSATEQLIMLNLHKEIRRRTTIIIAHRISTLQHCDNIVVLENGRISQQGAHTSLLGAPGYYAKLYKLQQQESALEKNI